MQTIFQEFSTKARLIVGDETLLSEYKTPKQISNYTFIITQDAAISIVIDGVPIEVKAHSILSLTPIQTLSINKVEHIIVYQFNREFYCIKDHDHEVGCAGLLFFGNQHIPIIQLDAEARKSFSLLHQVIIEELANKDTIQAEMLRILMARFIIKTTRILKSSGQETALTKKNVDLLRQYNLLVEENFKEQHSVSYYANVLFKSPKTLSNSFSKLNTSPLKIIHERIVLEAKRMLLYTNKSAKEIAYEIGFDDASHLSRMFKKQTGISPSAFKSQLSNPS